MESTSHRPSLGLNSNDLAGRMRRRDIHARPVSRAPRYMTEVRERRMAIIPAKPVSSPIFVAPPKTRTTNSSSAYKPHIKPTPHLDKQYDVQVTPKAVSEHHLYEEVQVSETSPLPIMAMAVAGNTQAGPTMPMPIPLASPPMPMHEKSPKHLPRFKWSSIRRHLIETVVVIVLAGMAYGTYTIVAHKPGEAKMVESTVETKIAYDVFLPGGGRFTPHPETLDYNTRTEIYSYVASNKNGVQVYVNQAPDTSANRSQFAQFINKDVKRLVTGSGTFDLAHPEQLEGGQVVLGGMNGTLLFARTEEPLPESDWQYLIDNFKKHVD